MLILKDLPVIVDQPGLYVTRGGISVDVTANCRETVSTFKVEGYILRTTRSGKIKREWNIWHESGRYQGGGEHSLDIIKKKV